MRKFGKLFLGIVLICVLFFGFLYLNNDIGVSANRLEKDIRALQKIPENWVVNGNISDTMAAFISYPQDKTDHAFSIYVNRPGLSFGYFFRGGGDIVATEKAVAQFLMEGYDECAYVSMNTQNIVRLEIDDGHNVQVIDLDGDKPFAIVLPRNAGEVRFFDGDGNIVEILTQTL